MRNLTPSTYTGLCRICPLSYVLLGQMSCI